MSAAADWRPRRSVLYMPGANARALEKARGLAADALIFDLEDAVAPEAKAEARDRVVAAVAGGGYGPREVTVRVNGLGTEWHDADLAAVAAAGPAGVVVPKISSASQVHDVARALERAGAPEHTRIWAMLETPRAVLHAAEIANSSPRLAVLVMGTNDLVKELHAQHVPGRAPLLPALAWCVLAARDADVAILDGVFNDVSDVAGLAAQARQGRELGFDGKTLIHPGQLAACNAAFSPGEADVAEARAVVTAWQEAQRDRRGVVTLNGRMIEQLHVAEAERVLATAAAIAALAASQ